MVNKLNELLVQPLKLALGIDEYKKEKSIHRSWFRLMELTLDLLSSLKSVDENNTGKDSLKKKIFSEVANEVNRQMSTMKFYTAGDAMSQAKLVKIELTPLTNSASELNLGDLTYDITCSAGSDTRMKTFSNKNVIRKNNVFVSTKWKEMTSAQRVAK